MNKTQNLKRFSLAPPYTITISPNIEFRQWNLGDAEALHTTLTDQKEWLRKNFLWAQTELSLASVQAFIEKATNKSAEKSGYSYGYWSRDRLCGGFTIHLLGQEDGAVDLAFWLVESIKTNEWDQNMFAKRLHSLLDWIFSTHRSERILIRIQPTNALGRQIAQKLGFERTQDRTMVPFNAPEEYYVLLKRTWQLSTLKVV